MGFYQHTQNWLKGEQFEGTIILVTGIILQPLKQKLLLLVQRPICRYIGLITRCSSTYKFKNRSYWYLYNAQYTVAYGLICRYYAIYKFKKRSYWYLYNAQYTTT